MLAAAAIVVAAAAAVAVAAAAVVVVVVVAAEVAAAVVVAAAALLAAAAAAVVVVAVAEAAAAVRVQSGVGVQSSLDPLPPHCGIRLMIKAQDQSLAWTHERNRYGRFHSQLSYMRMFLISNTCVTLFARLSQSPV